MIAGRDHGSTPVVVVTGASSGIGEQTALCFARRHARLALFSRDVATLDEVADRCRRLGAGEVLVVGCDISERRQVQEAFRTAQAHFGQVDIAAQCAAVTAFGRFDDIPGDVFNQIVSTNLLGAANVARCALAHFNERGSGQLVVMGSLLGSTAVPYQSAYVASKFAVNGLVRSLRQENRRSSGIRIHGIYPGPVDTPVYGRAANYLGRMPRTPLAAYSAERVAKVVVRATERRRSGERQVGIVNKPAIAVYRLLPRLFDAVITPLLHLTAFRSRPEPRTAGNVFGPAGWVPPPDAV